MTPGIAYTKRCCGPEGCGAKSDDGQRYCIASQCMAWQSEEMYKCIECPSDNAGSGFPYKCPAHGTMATRVNLGDCGLKR